MLFVEDVARAAAAAGVVPKEPGSFGMRVTLIPFDGVSELDRVDIDGVTVVARGQVILDDYDGGDRGRAGRHPPGEATGMKDVRAGSQILVLQPTPEISGRS
ncbi:MAG TPA: hypothetical protein VFJ97_07795 [Dermatophilaceae bacterium]|nr:hypothetical protein [Dermatophilaceae bacterium]